MTDFETYHVNEKGERVTIVTCTCSQCGIAREMFKFLEHIDRKYGMHVSQHDPASPLRYLDEHETRAHVRKWEAERSALISQFAQVWTGCLMPMVFVRRNP